MLFNLPSKSIDVQKTENTIDFQGLHGSDRKTYSFASLSRGRPVVFFLLKEEDGALGLADIAKLSRDLGKGVAVIGLADGPDCFRNICSRYHPKFLVLDQQWQVESQEVGDHNWVCGLEMCLVSPRGSLLKSWFGYDRYKVRDLVKRLRVSTGRRFYVNLSKYPKELVQGFGTFQDPIP